MPLPISTTILLAAASVALILNRYRPGIGDRLRYSLLLSALILAGGVILIELQPQFSSKVSPQLAVLWCTDALSRAQQGLVLLFGLLAGIIACDSHTCSSKSSIGIGELLFAVAGMMLTAQSNDLLTLGLSLEIINLAVNRWDCVRAEFGTSMQTGPSREPWVNRLTSIWTWVGIALLSNATATTNLDSIRQILASTYRSTSDSVLPAAPSRLVLLAVGLIIICQFIRSGIVLFRFETAAGKPGKLNGDLACVAMAEQLTVSIILLRLCGNVFVGLSPPLTTLLITILIVQAALSAVLAAHCLSPAVNSIPRWLTSVMLLQNVWWTIGLMVVSIELDNPSVRLGAFARQYESQAVVIFMQLACLLVNFGLFAALRCLERPDREVLFLEDLKGLWRQSPVISVALIFLLGSLIGIPFTAGFWSRWLLMLAGCHIHLKSIANVLLPHVGIRFTILLATAVSLLNLAVIVRLAREIVFEQPLGRSAQRQGRGPLLVCVVAAAACVVLGVAPRLVLDPLKSVTPPFSSTADAPSTGSGRVPLGWIGKKPESTTMNSSVD